MFGLKTKEKIFFNMFIEAVEKGVSAGEKLNASFITPFDREDIFYINVANTLEGVVMKNA